MAILAFSSNNIFDSTSAGRALLTAADASAQRTLLGLSSSSAVSFQSLVLSGQSLTGSTATSVFDATTTWNTTGTPVAWKLNVTDTASGGNPLLIDLQANSSSRFDVTAKVAATYIGQFSHNGLPRVRFSAQSSGAAIEIFAGSSNSFIGFGTIGSTVSRLYAEDASNGIIGQRNGVNPQTFRVYNTFTDISNYERAKIAWSSNVLQIGTEKLGTGVARALELQTDGTTRITIGSTGNVGIGTANLTRQLNIEGGDGIRSNPASSNLFSTAGWKRALEITKDSAILTSFSGTTYSISQSGNNFYIGYSSANDASAAIAYRLFIDSSGNIGVGTTSPSALLSVGASNNFTVDSSGNVNLVSPANIQVNRTNDAVGNNAINLANQFGLQITGTAGDFQINKRTGGVWSNTVTVLNTNGNVGIGTNNPSGKLGIADTVLAGSGSLATSLVDLTQTWNTTGTPTAIKLNVTDTASNASSLLMDLQLNGSSRLSLSKSGTLNVSSQVNSNVFAIGGGAGIVASSTRLGISTLCSIDFSSTTSAAGTPDVSILRESTGTLAQRSGVIPQTLRIYNTFTDSSNYERGIFSWSSSIFQIGTEKLGTGVARTMDLLTDGTTRLRIASDGYLFLGNGGTNNIRIYNQISGAGVLEANTNGIAFDCRVRSGTTASSAFWVYYGNDCTSGTQNLGRFSGGFNPTSGTADHNNLLLGMTINQTGGASGITRGLYVNPILTAAADWRAIEVANGPVVFTDTYAAGSGSLAGSLLNLSQTWNTTGTPTAILLNVTDTASNASSLLMDLRVGGVSMFKVAKTGRTDINNTLSTGGFNIFCGALMATSFIGVDSSGDTKFHRDAAGIFAQRNGVNAQTFRVYNTYTDASNYERGFMRWSSNVLQLGSEHLGTGSARAVSIQTAGTSRLNISSSAPDITVGNDANAPSIFSFTSNTYTNAANGRALAIFARSGSSAGDIGIALTGDTVLATSGSVNIATLVHRNFSPTSGTAAFQLLRLAPTINQTGGANGATRGISIAPNLTAAADWAALESVNGSFIIGDAYAAGSGSLAGSLLNLSQTWNTTGTPTAIKLNVTNTASGGVGRLLDLQVGGTSVFNVGRDGVVRNASIAAAYADGVCITAQAAARCFAVGYLSGNNVQLGSTTSFGWTAGADSYAALETILVRDAAHTIAQRNGVNAQVFRLYNTFTDSSNYERAKFAWESNVLRIGTEKLGTGTARQLDLQTDGTTRISIAGNGTISTNNAINVVSGLIVQIAQVAVAGSGTQYCYDAGTTTYSGTSGSTSIFACRSSFAPTSGTMNFTGFTFLSTINQTGGANGITRGIYINPTLTSAADFRAIEVTAGKTIVAPSTTTSASLNIPSGTAPTSPVDGDIWFDGTALKIRIGGVTKTVTVT